MAIICNLLNLWCDPEGVGVGDEPQPPREYATAIKKLRKHTYYFQINISYFI